MKSRRADLGIFIPFRGSFPSLRLQFRLRERKISRRKAMSLLYLRDRFALNPQPNIKGVAVLTATLLIQPIGAGANRILNVRITSTHIYNSATAFARSPLDLVLQIRFIVCIVLLESILQHNESSVCSRCFPAVRLR